MPGSSSNIAFMRQVTRAMETAGRGQIQTPKMSQDLSNTGSGIAAAFQPTLLSCSIPADSNAPEAGNMIHSLPPDSVTRDLLGLYFSNTGLLFPFIHEPSFFQEYDAMRSNTVPRVRRTWLGLLNIVLAMATSTSADPKKSPMVRRNESDVFYQRAYELCKKQMLRGANLETGTQAVKSHCLEYLIDVDSMQSSICS
jgi:hypothetical protein